MKTMSYISNSVTTGDNQHPLEAFFGPYRGSRESMRADDQLAHETYNLPKAYEGKNRFLEEVLEFKIRDESDFYTSKLLPWQLSDDIHIKWDIFTFNRSIADIEPEQGVPRFVSAESESHSDTLIRRGLAFMVEHSRVYGIFSGTMADQCRKASSGVVTPLSNSCSPRRQALVA